MAGRAKEPKCSTVRAPGGWSRNSIANIPTFTMKWWMWRLKSSHERRGMDRRRLHHSRWNWRRPLKTLGFDASVCPFRRRITLSESGGVRPSRAQQYSKVQLRSKRQRIRALLRPRRAHSRRTSPPLLPHHNVLYKGFLVTRFWCKLSWNGFRRNLQKPSILVGKSTWSDRPPGVGPSGVRFSGGGCLAA